MAPEQIANDGRQTRRVDCWALGLVLLEIGSGKRVNEFRENYPCPAFSQDFPNENDLNMIKDLKIKHAVRGLLQRRPEDRERIEEILKFFDS